MPDGAPAEIFAAVTVAAGLDWFGILYVSAVSHTDWAVFGQSKCVSAISGRYGAVKHIDAGPDGGNNVGWCADAHQVARFVPRQKLRCVRDCFYHIVLSFAYT